MLTGGIANNGNLLTVGGPGSARRFHFAHHRLAATHGCGPGNILFPWLSNYAGAIMVGGRTLNIGTPNALPFVAAAGNITVSGRLR